ncbi:MAG: hypothetical protein PUC98_08170 [Clostridiales bacterium]|nr:hypothetical protein [Clostridiales bacterium]
MRAGETTNLLKYIILPAAGMLFLFWYIRAAGADVVYSDYFRIINDYLPDVGDIRKLLVPDILTRIPAAFLARLINVSSFGYSVTFDRMLTAAGFAIMAGCLAVYSYKHEIAFKWQICIYIILFSLNKWEIILNGTAWAHVVSFGLFFINYLLIDLVWSGEASGPEELLVCAMPLVMLLFAGEYIVSYACTLMLLSLLGILTGGANSWAARREKSLFRRVLIVSALSLILYVLSRSFAVWQHAGASDIGIIEMLKQDPAYPVRFFVRTFSGTAVGQETAAAFFRNGAPLPDGAVLVLGLAVMAAYVLAVILYFRSDMLEKTVFPLVLIVSGAANHVLVTAARWNFLNENYAMSSRYGGQLMIGLIGIILVFSMFGKQKRSYRRAVEQRRRRAEAAAAVITVLIILGNCYTTYQEIHKAKYREENYERMAEAILHYEAFEEEALMSILEWHKAPEDLYSAIRILKDNKLNVFRKPHFDAGPEER